jgi:SET domain-containing protein
VRFLDLKEYGNLARLVNDEQLRPNLQLYPWPILDDDAQPPILPRRFYLVALRDIPALTELTWDYGEQRPGLHAQTSPDSSSPGPSSSCCPVSLRSSSSVSPYTRATRERAARELAHG